MNGGTPAEQTGKQKEVLFFFLKLLAVWLSWKVIIYILGNEARPIQDRMIPALSKPWEELNNGMRWVVLQGSDGVLHLLGHETENTGYFLRIKGNRGFGLGNYCLAFQLMYYYIMLVLISGLKPMRKFGAIISGIPIVIILNIIRFSSLCLLIVYRPSLLTISHEYIFNFIVLGVLFLYYTFLIRRSERLGGGVK